MFRYIKEDYSKQFLNIKNKLGTSASRYKFVEKYYMFFRYTFVVSTVEVVIFYTNL